MLLSLARSFRFVMSLAVLWLAPACWSSPVSGQAPHTLTTISPEQIDPAATAVWVDGKTTALDPDQRETNPLWVLWTSSPKLHPGHNGMAFGAGKLPGPRHLRIGLKEPATIGSVLVKGGGAVSVLRPTATAPGDLADDTQWLPASRLGVSGIHRDEAGRDDLAIWVLPPGTKSQAIRFTHLAAPADSVYEGYLGGVLIAPQRWANLAPMAAPAAESNHRYADRIINGKSDQWNTWENLSQSDAEESPRPEISAEHPEWILLTWPSPVNLDRLLAVWSGFAVAKVQAYVGPADRHPRDASDADWQTVGDFQDLENGYPTPFWPNALPFASIVRTRAIRLQVTAVTVPRHPHVMRRTAEGKRIWLGELMACVDLGQEPLNELPLPAPDRSLQDEPHAPIAVRFELPEPGFVTLVIEDSTGKRIRNLVSETPFPAGLNVAWWDGADDLGRDVEAADHGLFNIPARLVTPGKYRARGLWRKKVEAVYEFPVYSSGSPPWSTADHTGAWLANHSPPSAAVFVPAKFSPTGAPSVFLGSYVTEGPDGFAWVDLNGVKRGGLKWIGGNWTAAPYLGRDTGPQAPVETAAYVASVWPIEKGSNISELRITALQHKNDGKLTPTPVLVQKLPAAGESGDRFEQIGGVAAYNGQIVCSLREQNQLLWIDAAGKTLGQQKLDDPRGLCFDSSGRLLVLSGTTLVRFALADPAADNPIAAGPPETLIADGLEDPFGLTLDASGSIYISDQGASHQVKVYDSRGKLVRLVGRRGLPAAGDYDPLHMNHPAGLAVDSEGQLWVAEHDYLPKRVSVWSPEGKLIRAFYGPGKYGGGGSLDSQDRTRFCYADEGRGALEFQLNWEQGTSQLSRVLYRSSSRFPLPFRAAAPETPLYRSGQRYLTNCYNTNPTGGHNTAFLFHDRDGVAQPAAAMGRANDWPILKTEPFLNLWPEGADPQGDPNRNNGANQAFFIWSDANADAQVQPDEVMLEHLSSGGVTVMADLSFCIANCGGQSLRIPPQRFTPTGVPLYQFADRQVLADEVQRPGSSGGNQVLADDSDEAVVTLGVGPFHQQSLSGVKDGHPAWSYPSPWPGLHASHRAAQPDRPGQVIGSTRLLGGFFEPAGAETEPLWAINGNMGNFYIFTRDGLFVATMFEDSRQGKSWKMPIAQRGMSLAGITLHDENFWPSITRSSDGKVYAVDGSRGSLVRLKGLESLRSIHPFPVEVTPDHLAEAQTFVLAREAQRQASFGKGTLHAVVQGDRPAGEEGLQVDGLSQDWNAAEWVDIDKRGVAANFNANSKPFNVRGALAVRGDRLFAAWSTTQPDLLRNSGELPVALFKTGGALDLMLATDPAADPQRREPAQGDLRLLVTQVDKETKALLYRPVSPNAQGEKVPFSSPWRTITFDQVKDVSDQVQLATDGKGFYEISVPLALLGLAPQAGSSTKGDIGVLRGNGSETTARSYWSNKATGITADVPSEAALTPHLWGAIHWQVP
ncbi:NHL repeat-containing protein [Lignipirellula cremea]|uniref:NHL repeat protein n=1 Tax=Lignipirellula cremea TaxID=2528010 RepID=A0A518DSD0_9BACT|nr:hypothetical protein [Lignipirellula cremea]QDU94739.1 NHL repeat protein [Lignipirellula cremea]